MNAYIIPNKNIRMQGKLDIGKIYSLRIQEIERVQKILEKATSEEREKLSRLWACASLLAGNSWNKESPLETNDENIEKSAELFGEFRILLANIEHRHE